MSTVFASRFLQPYDQSAIPAIEKAIMASDLGLTPGNDGRLIRLQIPQLTSVSPTAVPASGGLSLVCWLVGI